MRGFRRLLCAIRGGHEWVGLVRSMMCVRCGIVRTHGKLGDKWHER